MSSKFNVKTWFTSLQDWEKVAFSRNKWALAQAAANAAQLEPDSNTSNYLDATLHMLAPGSRCPIGKFYSIQSVRCKTSSCEYYEGSHTNKAKRLYSWIYCTCPLTNNQEDEK